MVPGQNVKFVSVTPPAAIIDDAAVTTAYIDTLGFDYATIGVYGGATDIAMTVLKVQHSDASGSGYADIDGLDFDGDTNIDGSAAALPSATDDNLFHVAQIDLRGKKRYLDVSATVGDGTSGAFVAIFAILSRAEEAPVTIAQMGCNEVLRA